MPESTLNYALELREARDELLLDAGVYNESSRQEVLRKEQEYVKFSKELSEMEVILNVLPEILADSDNKTFGRMLQTQACYVGFLSQNTDLWEQLIPYCFADWDISQLDTERQKDILDLLASKHNIRLAMRICLRNGYTEYLPALRAEMAEIDDPVQIRQFQNIMAYYIDSEWRERLNQAFKDTTDDFMKEMLAEALLPAQLDELISYYQARLQSGMDKEGGGTLCRIGSPKDLIYFEECAKVLWGDPESLSRMGEQLIFLGSVQGFSWYWSMLRHPDDGVRRSFHRLMLSFFPEDDESMYDGWNLIGEYYDDPTASTHTLQQYWVEKSDHVKEVLDVNTRYWFGRPFNLINIFHDVAIDGDTTQWETYVQLLEVWTGEHFLFDVDALIEKQIEQYNAILQWVEAHSNHYPEGHWYRWGSQL